MINNLGVDPIEWFDDYHLPETGNPFNPLDLMPIATNQPYERKDPPAELMEIPTSVESPKPKPKTKVEETPHHIAYEIATAKYNPFSVGGTEQLGGGSEIIQK
tara:strand:- start:707 stop:1015 length:309 start_codon:yes stop_codon:yes gene_type:complete